MLREGDQIPAPLHAPCLQDQDGSIRRPIFCDDRTRHCRDRLRAPIKVNVVAVESAMISAWLGKPSIRHALHRRQLPGAHQLPFGRKTQLRSWSRVCQRPLRRRCSSWRRGIRGPMEDRSALSRAASHVARGSTSAPCSHRDRDRPSPRMDTAGQLHSARIGTDGMQKWTAARCSRMARPIRGIAHEEPRLG